MVHPEVSRRLPPAGRILDFGCGAEGNQVAELHALGCEVYGCDPAVGKSSEYVRRMINGLIPFPEEHFDFVFSQEVFEHVADLSVVRELARVTRRGGTGFHVFPARWRPVEPHLHQPLVHWLPKNEARRWLIHAWSILGVEPPDPPEIPGANRKERADFQYAYSKAQTFYRPYRDVVEVFRDSGFRVQSGIPSHRSLIGWRRLVPRIDWAVSTFLNVHLEVWLAVGEEESSVATTEAATGTPYSCGRRHA